MMREYIFLNKSSKPKDVELAAALGRSKKLWDALIDHLVREFEPVTHEWKIYSQKWGWTLRLLRRKRAILYLTPFSKHFAVGTTLGAKAVKAAMGSKLSREIKDELRVARQYAEGRGVRIEVRKQADLEQVKLLAEIKMAN